MATEIVDIRYRSVETSQDVIVDDDLFVTGAYMLECVILQTL